MTLKYLGHAAFLIKSKDGKAVTDPFDPSIGLKFPTTEADIVTISHGHQDHNYLKGISGEPLVIDYPGEFEKKGIRVTGYKSYHDKKKGEERGENIMYKIDADEINILHCGDLGAVPDDDLIDQVGEVDILLVPVGGSFTIGAEEAVSLIKKIEPQIVVPMHYNREGLNEKVFSELSPVDDFLKKMGIDSPQKESQLTFKKEDMTGEMKVVVMEISS